MYIFFCYKYGHNTTGEETEFLVKNTSTKYRLGLGNIPISFQIKDQSQKIQERLEREKGSKGKTKGKTSIRFSVRVLGQA